MKNVTPQDAWSRHKPSIKYLKIFGCIAYAQIPKQKRKKLDDRGEKYIFIGYYENSKVYKLFNPITNKVIIRRDIIFDEDATWNWSTKEETQRQKIMDQEIEEIEEKSNIYDPPLPTTLSQISSTSSSSTYSGIPS